MGTESGGQRRFFLPKDFLHSAQASSEPWSKDAAFAYTRWLATSHYENFHVVSFLLPRRLHQDFFNVYAFCRWADDLGDEIGDPEESLRLLDWWRDQLNRCFAGEAEHPVFIALGETNRRHELPAEPFHHLIDAFVQDQTVNRYKDFEQLLGYCNKSANPVGRLVLHLCGYRDPQRMLLSDATCTALQLANFWQDVTVDLEKDRVYLPLETLDRYGYTVAELYGRRFNRAFRAAMRELVARTRALFEQGLPLAGMVDRRLALDIELFSRGGMKILEKIEQQNYDVLGQRPVITRTERAGLLLRALLRLPFARAA